MMPFTPYIHFQLPLAGAPAIGQDVFTRLNKWVQNVGDRVRTNAYAKARSKAIDKAQIAFINFIIATAQNSAFSEDLKWQVDNFKAKSPEQQVKLFPGFYLFIERYIFNSLQTSQRAFREVLYQQFKFAIDHVPSLKIIFLPQSEQKIELFRSFLRSLARKCQRHSRVAHLATELQVWLTEGGLVSFSHTRSADALDQLVDISQDYYYALRDAVNEKQAIKFFNEVYHKFSLRYQNLETFPDILKLFPNRALDEAKYNLLSLQQMKRLLAEKVMRLEAMSNELSEKNKLLEQSNDELFAQSEQLNDQNHRLTEAQSLIQIMNEELASYSRKLEDKVRERTEELAHSNDLLIVHNQNLEQYTFTISHQLKAPIARLLGLTHLLNLVPAAEIPVVAKSVQTSAKELEEVFKELVHSLNLKKESAEIKKERLNLKEVLQETWQKIQGSSNVAFNLKGDASIKTDKVHLTKAVEHVLGNAIKFARTNNDHHVDTEIFQRSGKIEICIKDNGTGFDLEEHRAKLFTPYQRFNMTFGGRGMGLYLTKQHVSILGGSIRLASTPHQGTEVLIEIPALTNSES